MKKRRNEAERLNHATRRPDYVIAPDGLIPNSVIRAKIKGISNSPALPNRPNQAPVNNQLSLKETPEERKPMQQTPETTSSASTFYWESDPDDERIGPRTKEIVEVTPSGSTNQDVVQTVEDSGSYDELKASDVLQIHTEETETDGVLDGEPKWAAATKEELRNPEGLGVDEGLSLESELNDPLQGCGVRKDLHLEKDVNADHCGFSCGSHFGHLPSTYDSGAKVTDLWGISSDGEAPENVTGNGGYLPSDPDLSDAHVMMKHITGNDVERSDTGSNVASCVTLRNDDDDEEEEDYDVDKLCSAIVGLDELLREGEEQSWEWKTSVLTIGLETGSPHDGKPMECPSISMEEEPDKLNVLKKKRQLLQPRLASKVTNKDRQMAAAAGHTTQYHTIKIPSTDKWGGRRLLPNNPEMYRMYKKRNEMLKSV